MGICRCTESASQPAPSLHQVPASLQACTNAPAKSAGAPAGLQLAPRMRFKAHSMRPHLWGRPHLDPSSAVPCACVEHLCRVAAPCTAGQCCTCWCPPPELPATASQLCCLADAQDKAWQHDTLPASQLEGPDAIFQGICARRPGPDRLQHARAAPATWRCIRRIALARPAHA